MRYLLNSAYLLGLTAAAPLLAYKMATTGKYRRGLGAKFFGAPPALPTARPVVWFHAVSVGEVLLLRPLLERIAADYPHLQPVLSTSTDAGRRVADEKYPNIPTFFAPLDFTWALDRVFAALNPRLLVLAELELWPNLLLTARQRQVPVAVVNMRLGERSYRGYRRLKPMLGSVLRTVAWWGVQTPTYADRLADLLGTSDTLTLTGSLKYENALRTRTNPKTQELRRLFGLGDTDRVWVAGSTMEPEEQIVLDAYRTLRARHPELRLILVPRHPERFAAVADLLARSGLEFCRRSELREPRAAAAVTLVDTVGELAAVWGLADVGFVGGSLENGRGGQSMIEPAGYGVPVCFGPSTRNFKDTVEQLLERDAARQLPDRHALATTIEQWLEDPASAQAMGARARLLVESQVGALQRTLTGLDRWLAAGVAAKQCA